MRNGLIDAETANELGHSGLPVSSLSGPEMAVHAGRAALAVTGTPHESVGLLLHSWIHYQGHDLWSPGHFIADRLRLSRALPLGIQQVCNGGAMAIDMAVARLLADPTTDCAMVTTGDRFVEPGFQRWRADYGIAYGDGATALLVHPLDTRPADLVLHSISTVAAVELERMHRGSDPFSPAPLSLSSHVDIRRTKKAFLAEGGMETFAKISRARLEHVVLGCLAEGDLTPDDPRLRCVVMPRLGRKTLDFAYRPALAATLRAELLDFGRDTGHLGAGDTTASLQDLIRGDFLDPGEYAVVISAGAGFTWSALLVSRGPGA
ncbi:3-oxoacyl-[acyl-carrier-protein] synthase III C-terminal domain-containing protein [Streptomyces cellulosae]|uniref:3-oxoacyl-[acyl-carrier-protein] synthase III C-terminal domain-containing protein n=1 Tax=Streptomyces cellulosae TaxID=1968 RepID=UPI001901B0AD|nr:3-oxoacyl-[acyl-carrier-protein] synthase III C-terminal domain-containing protein [Streptomyces cellulosae]